MSWWDFFKPKPKPPAPVPAPPVYTVRVEVFSGDPAADDKVPGATVTLTEPTAAETALTDGAGNVAFFTVAAGSHRVDVSADGFVTAVATAIVPGPPTRVSLERDIPPVSKLRVDGRFFVNDAGTFRPLFASELAILPKSREERAAVFTELRELGFNGFRTFAGALAWAGQTAESARAELPGLLVAAAAQGLYVFVSANTDSGTGYDVESHTHQQASTCAASVNALLEIANEPYHPTQSKQVQDIGWLRSMARRVVPAGLPYCLGAATVDEPEGDGTYPTDGGTFNTAHLDRGRDRWNQVRRIREIENISATTRKPAFSGEPIGAAEVAQPGKRESDPAFFFAMGALCRGFEVPAVFHSDYGLQGRPLGPNQKACAAAMVAGFRSLDTAARLTFQNTGWQDSPIASADFDRGVVRAYSFVTGNAGYTVLVGVNGEPGVVWKNGWSAREVIAARPGVRVLRIAR